MAIVFPIVPAPSPFLNKADSKKRDSMKTGLNSVQSLYRNENSAFKSDRYQTLKFLRSSHFMQCTVLNATIWVIAAIIYGSGYAAQAQGLKYFSPGVFILFRMLFGLSFTLIVFIIRFIMNRNGYRQIVRAHFNSGIRPILWLLFGGFLNLGISHCIIIQAQKWLPSCSVQLMQPFQTSAGAIFAHFFLPGENFTIYRLFSILTALCGVVCTGIPAFMHANSGDTTISLVALGYVLIFLGMCMFGISPPLFKLKAPNADVSISVSFQLLMAIVTDIAWALIFDGPASIQSQIQNAPPIAWMWPALVGSLASGVAVHCWALVINRISPFACNLLPFAQMVVGVVVGVSLGEWNKYNTWQIALNVVGAVILLGSMILGFHTKPPEKTHDEEEEEEDKVNKITSHGEPALPYEEDASEEARRHIELSEL